MALKRASQSRSQICFTENGHRVQAYEVLDDIPEHHRADVGFRNARFFDPEAMSTQVQRESGVGVKIDTVYIDPRCSNAETIKRSYESAAAANDLEIEVVMLPSKKAPAAKKKAAS